MSNLFEKRAKLKNEIAELWKAYDMGPPQFGGEMAQYFADRDWDAIPDQIAELEEELSNVERELSVKEGL